MQVNLVDLIMHACSIQYICKTVVQSWLSFLSSFNSHIHPTKNGECESGTIIPIAQTQVVGYITIELKTTT